MAYRNRTCTSCNETIWTASKAEICLVCQKDEKKQRDTQSELQRIKDWGYSVAGETTLNKHNHRYYTLATPCGHEWKVTFTNLIKQTSVAAQKNLPPPCGICGPQRRMKVALAGFMDKYGRDYDLQEYQDYVIKVRGLSEVVYRKNKDELNPNNVKRGRAGEENAYHLDHKIPIIECFKRGWTPEQASAKENLQMLEAFENMSKGAQINS